MRVHIGDILELLRLFELRDLWKDARDAPEGTTLHRWRHVVQGLVLVISVSLLLTLPLLIVCLILK